MAVLVIALLAATMPRVGGAAAAEVTTATTAGDPCVKSVPPTTVLNTTATRRPLAGGVGVSVAMPAVVPPDARAVVLVSRASATAAGDVTAAPAAAPAAVQPVVAARVRQWVSSTALVPTPGASLVVTFGAASKATADVTIQVVGYTPNNDCFTSAGATRALDSTSGRGLSAAGPVAPGVVHFDLQAQASVPADAGSVATTIRLATRTSAVQVSLQDEAGVTVLSRSLPASTVSLGAEFLPPSESDRYSLVVSGGSVDVLVMVAGWFRNSNALAQSSTLVLDTANGVGWKGLLSSGSRITLPVPADATAAASVVLSMTLTAKQDSAVFVWPAGDARPALPAVNVPKGVATSATVVVGAGAQKAVSVEVGSGSVQAVATLSAWSPIPPAVNESVPGVTHVATEADVPAASLDNTTGDATVAFAGSDHLDKGDVVVVPPTPELPEGYLGVVTGVNAAVATGFSSASGDDIVSLTPAALSDAIPNADFDSGALPVDTPAPPPLDTTALPGDDGSTPTVTSTPTVDGTTTATATATATPSETTVQRADGVASALESTGGSLSPRFSMSCSAGVQVGVAAALQLHAGVGLSASIHWTSVSADFGFDGGLSGTVAVWADAGATCDATAAMTPIKLPTLRFSIGPVPVWVTPQLSLTARLRGTVGGAVRASASANIGLKTGVHYQNGTFTPYWNPYATFPVSLDARLGGSLEAELIPRLDLKVYGVAGPYAEIGGFARVNIDLLKNPWWCAEAGVRAGVGFALDVWLLSHKSFDAGRRELLRFGAGCASGPFPGPVITTTSLPQATVGSYYSTALGATGGRAPYSWTLVSGGLPPGLSLSKAGTIAGTPSTAGAWSFTVRALDSAGYRAAYDKTLGLGVGQPAPVVTDPPPPSGSSVTLTKGASAQGLSGCSSTACRWLDVSARGFPANTRLLITCKASPYDEGGWYSYYKYTDGSGNGWWPGTSTGGCYYGYPGRTVWVTVSQTDSNRIVW